MKTFEIGDRVRYEVMGSPYYGKAGKITCVKPAIYVIDFDGGGYGECGPAELARETSPALAEVAPPKIEAGKFYRMSGGGKMLVYATDGDGEYPVHGTMESDRRPYCWKASGHYEGRDFHDGASNHACDIIAPWVDEPRRHARWFNLYPYHGFATREDADRADDVMIKRKACKLIEWTEGEGLTGDRP